MGKRYIACVGRMHAGKDVFCEILEQLVAPASIRLIRFSDPLGNCLKRMKAEMTGLGDMPLDRHNYQWFSTIIREGLDHDILANWVRREALDSDAQWVFIMGMRKLQDMPAMRKLPGCTVVHIDAPQKLRFEWTERSAQKKGIQPPRWWQFVEQDGQECEVDIDELAEGADYHIYNDQDDPALAHLRSRTQRFLDDLLKA